MADSSWDNNGQPMQHKKGMSIWAKVALGCGVVFLLGLGGCVVLGVRGAQYFKKAMDVREWGMLRAMVQQLESDEGARALYKATPDLWKTYPSEDDFLSTVQTWRPKLEPLPENRPDFIKGQLSYSVNSTPGVRHVELGYTNSKGTRINSTWENGRIQMISVN